MTNKKNIDSTMIEEMSVEELQALSIEAGQEIDNPSKKSNKKTYFAIIFILVNIGTIAIMLGIELGKGRMSNFGDAMAIISNNVIWLWGAIFVWVIKNLLDSLCYLILIKRTTGEIRIFLAIKIAILGKYGDGITPMATGGQPFQVFYLHKYNIPISDSVSIPLTRVTTRIIGYDLLMFLFFIFFAQQGSSLVKGIAYFGLFLNSLGPVAILLFAFNPKWCYKITGIIINLLHRFMIIKNPEETTVRYLKKVEEMTTSIRNFSKSKHIFIGLVLISMVEVLCLTSVPYFVVKAFGGGNDVAWLFMAVSAMYVTASALVSPTPGTAGAAEASFYGIFAGIIAGNLIFYVVMLWRIITYYSIMVGGFFLMIFESIFRKKKDVDKIDELRGRMTNRLRKMTEKINDITHINDIKNKLLPRRKEINEEHKDKKE